jgi:zinc/manganese transport system substrate-binding protein
MRRIVFLLLAAMLAPILGGAAPVKVAALHPLMADLARQTGGALVEVFDLVGEGGNPHRFEPRPADLRKLQESDLVLAGGKNLEPYLGRVRETLGGITILEVGRTIPSLTVGKDVVYSCCPAHASGGIDPHWWHGVENTRRAARVVAQALAEKDPAHKDTYMANAAAYGKRLGELKEWAKNELARVPRPQRTLVTAHNAFAYFAKEFGFDVIAVAGLTKEQNTTPQELANTIATVKAARLKAIFPEHDASQKILESIAAETGARIGHPLIADGNGTGKEAGFEAMIRHNVHSIVQSLTTP